MWRWLWLVSLVSLPLWAGGIGENEEVLTINGMAAQIKRMELWDPELKQNISYEVLGEGGLAVRAQVRDKNTGEVEIKDYFDKDALSVLNALGWIKRVGKLWVLTGPYYQSNRVEEEGPELDPES